MWPLSLAFALPRLIKNIISHKFCCFVFVFCQDIQEIKVFPFLEGSAVGGIQERFGSYIVSSKREPLKHSD